MRLTQLTPLFSPEFFRLMYRISPAVAPPMLHTEDSEIRSGGVVGDLF